MSKIVCDICGTVYPESEQECPICGCTKEMSAVLLADAGAEGEQVADVTENIDLFEVEPPVAAAAAVLNDEEEEETPIPVPVAVPDQEPAAIAADDDDDDDDFDDDDDDDDDDDFDDEEEEGRKSNGLLVVLLVIVILALLAVSAFILVKYVVPNVMGPEETAPATTQGTEALPETTQLEIPCENLALTSGGEVVLEAEGANWLLNVLAVPENTTDELTYTSSDEAVAIVNAQGKVTAVGEGTAVITITCGQQELKCTVTVVYPVETTVVPETEPVDVTEPLEGTEPVAPTEPEETTAPTEPTETTAPLKDVNLEKAINYKELTFNGPNQGVTIKIKGLKNEEVQWSSEDENVATVNEKGRILNTGKGTTYIVVRYGDQEVKIKIICRW